MIYWASGQPLLERKGLADDATWHLSIMHQGYAYAMVDGRPDEYVIESWLKSGMPKCVPETDPWSFTRSALDFTGKFFKRNP